MLICAADDNYYRNLNKFKIHKTNDCGVHSLLWYIYTDTSTLKAQRTLSKRK